MPQTDAIKTSSMMGNFYTDPNLMVLRQKALNECSKISGEKCQIVYEECMP